MQFKLKNGIVAEIKPLSSRDKPSELREFLAEILSEKPQPFIFADRLPSLSAQRKWIKKILQDQRRKKSLILIVRINGKIAGRAGAYREEKRDSDKVRLGIVIAKAYRGSGLGYALMKMLVSKAKKLFKPRVIYLGCIGANKPAQVFYKKFGFREFARFKKWQKHRGKYEDMIFLKLGG